ncbi:unnamed protein product [Closterium sp. NIES-54]
MPVRTRHAPCAHPPPIPCTHTMALRPSSVPQRVDLPSPLASSLPNVSDPESDIAHAASPTLALGSDVLEDRQFELECLAAAVPHLASFLLCPEGDPDAQDIPALRTHTKAITGEYSSQWQTAMDTKMASWKSTCTYVDEFPLPGANIVDGMWIFRVKRPTGSPPAFKECYVARGFSQRQGVEFFQTFSSTP